MFRFSIALLFAALVLGCATASDGSAAVPPSPVEKLDSAARYVDTGISIVQSGIPLLAHAGLTAAEVELAQGIASDFAAGIRKIIAARRLRLLTGGGSAELVTTPESRPAAVDDPIDLPARTREGATIEPPDVVQPSPDTAPEASAPPRRDRRC